MKECFGGYLGFRKTQNTYYWTSVTLKSVEIIIRYFDRYPLLGRKLLQYILWRKIYIKIQEGKHLEPEHVTWFERQKQKIGALKL